MKLLGKKRMRRCQYGCCGQDDRDGLHHIKRREKRREARFWKKDQHADDRD